MVAVVIDNDEGHPLFSRPIPLLDTYLSIKTVISCVSCKYSNITVAIIQARCDQNTLIEQSL